MKRGEEHQSDGKHQVPTAVAPIQLLIMLAIAWSRSSYHGGMRIEHKYSRCDNH